MHISVSEGESERSQGALSLMRGGWEEGLVGGLVSRLVSRISTDALCPECQPAPSRGFLAPILMLSGGLPTSPAGSRRRVHQRYLGQRLLLKAPPSGRLVPQPFLGPAAQPLWLRSTLPRQQRLHALSRAAGACSPCHTFAKYISICGLLSSPFPLFVVLLDPIMLLPFE